MYINLPPVAERLRWAYPALPERAGVGLIPANSDALNVPSLRRWRFEMKLSPFLLYTQPKNSKKSDCLGLSRSLSIFL
jgi:hypothetical protein